MCGNLWYPWNPEIRARNPILVEVLRDYGYVEARGMGVRRKLVPLTREFAGRDPVFDLTDDYLRVTLPTRLDATP